MMALCSWWWRLRTRLSGYRQTEPSQPSDPSTPWPVDTSSYPREITGLSFADAINCCLSVADVLEIINPVAPDHLCNIDPYRGIWEGYWANWNDLDKQRLRAHTRIERVGEATARAGEPGSMVLRFQVIGT